VPSYTGHIVDFPHRYCRHRPGHSIGCALCLFCTSGGRLLFLSYIFVPPETGAPMKKIAFGTAIVLALLSIAGCAQTGKGKAPPPVVTKG